MKDSLQIEKRIISKGRKYMIGVGYDGVDAIAGPIVSVALIADLSKISSELRDEGVTEKNKKKIYNWLKRTSYFISIGAAQANEIFSKEQGIELAKDRVVKRMIIICPWIKDVIAEKDTFKKVKKFFTRKKGIKIWIPKGRSYLIDGATLIAKKEREAFMRQMDELNPQYLFKENLGHPSPEHLKRLKRYGPNRNLHRLNLPFVKEFLAKRTKIIREKGKI